ncbi:hypothetical protein HPB47_001310 [Ixodes persulcatus]|uniref:Uncharacterized protein n=1 Tax=Ixodes persulcatus TaxID=34615 RepID=A0AC60PQV4_IXOPE|nr:hypothetical protein HPB47_001310 [Ixodes persulcatus]
MTPRAVTEQDSPLSATIAEPETKSEPHSTARSYAVFPKLNTPSKVEEAIAFKALELDAKYCRNMLGYKEGKVRHHSNTASTTGRRRRRKGSSGHRKAADIYKTVVLGEASADTEVGVLIGSDVYWKVATGQIRRLSEHLTARGVSVPSGSPKKELLVKLYRQHVLNDKRFTSGNYSSDEDVRDTSKEHDDSCTLSEVFDSFTSLSDDALFAKPRDFGFQVGPVVAWTPSPYERQLQQLLNNGSVPTTPPVPTDEFSATEEDEPQVIPEDNSDDEDGGMPLQKGHTTFFPLSRAAESAFVHLRHPQQQPSSGRFTCPYDAAFQTGNTAATTPAVGKQRRMYMAVKVLIVLVMITVNVLIYLRTPVEQGSFKRNILISRSRIAPIKPVTLHLVLCWSAGDATRWQQFVRNRVIEIQRLTEGFPWTHCPSHDNPVECIRVLKDSDVISVVWGERDQLGSKLHRAERMTPRAVTEQGTPLSSTTAEPEKKSKPHSTARSCAVFSKFNTPSKVGEAIAFKVLELDAKYCRNKLGYKEGKVGDVVIVEDDNTPCLLWKLGRVTKIFFGRHGVT